VAELAVANDNVAKYTNDVTTAKQNMDKELSKTDSIKAVIDTMNQLKTASEGPTSLFQKLQGANFDATIVNLGKLAKSVADVVNNPDISPTERAKAFNMITPTGLLMGKKHEGGLIHANSGMLIPGASPLRDRVPIMAEPGEGVMSRQAIENFLKTGMSKGNETVYNININPGTMIATPGEAREFARIIKKLLMQDESRLAFNSR
jgi:hypothetical protein